MKKLLFATLILFLTSCSLTNSGDITKTDILFLGDTSFGENYQENLDESILETQGYDYSLEQFTSMLDSSEVVISNLETPLTDLEESPLEDQKSYVHWSDTAKATKAYKKANITVFSLANNHSMDYGTEGLEQTLETLEENQMTAFGAGLTEDEAMEPYIYGDIAVIASFEFKESYDEEYNFYADENTAGVNQLSVVQITEQIQTLREENPDYFIIIFPHWGDNYSDANTNQKLLAHQLIDAGADLILGHGAHIMQEVESYKDKWVIYSIGNFMFNSPGRYEKYDLEPYSLIARIVELGQRKFLQLYPIYTDNTVTNYQSRFATEEEFEEVYEELQQDGLKRGKNSYGYYVRVSL